MYSKRNTINMFNRLRVVEDAQPSKTWRGRPQVWGLGACLPVALELARNWSFIWAASASACVLCRARSRFEFFELTLDLSLISESASHPLSKNVSAAISVCLCWALQGWTRLDGKQSAELSVITARSRREGGQPNVCLESLTTESLTTESLTTESLDGGEGQPNVCLESLTTAEKKNCPSFVRFLATWWKKVSYSYCLVSNVGDGMSW